MRHALLNSGDPELMEVASRIADLHSWRISADYHLDEEDVDETHRAQDLVRAAQQIIAMIESH